MMKGKIVLKELFFVASLMIMPLEASLVLAEWPLTRSPILLPTAMPGHLDCDYDEDHNGLDDEMEKQIAQYVAPEFRFDCGEPWWSLGPQEPHLVFNSYLNNFEIRESDGSLNLIVSLFTLHTIPMPTLS
jgi:hypothetical protein